MDVFLPEAETKFCTQKNLAAELTGIRQYYDGMDPVVVALHGSASLPLSMWRIAASLRRCGCTVHTPAYGFLGFGRHQPILDRLAAKLSHLPRFDIVGHSLGGLIGLQLAARPEFAGKIGTIVGLGANWRGMDTWYSPRIDAPAAPGVRIVSIVSDGDRVVPQWSSRLGEVVEVAKVSHSGLRALDHLVVQAIPATRARSTIAGS
ncbi:esterase/lipase family protein [Corynebacterium uberis]|uniref:esterase/lipase family protein n=1 Tax=Corynebacterium TaxID=1716 RepID=UPI001D09F46D|nr:MULTISPECIES: alpha/beta hydrolase [Corynebacterium]MCZ9309068.1 alpha/beta hydrolase [Corynebacterium sp. c6VSa_13]UDL74467.1 alpha/beta hydrolase [Corynebacterium uberis]UDL76698.1 alpha/beta hydrolase [Corynebacterium uberis]UDL78911.1 alpha/beta hydrolase [Corynebacterium uberis]UDL81189.1 alpha/beta hydrolase [Corynebacterium uberis]